MTDVEIVHELFARVRAADPAVADLYSDDATFEVGDVVHAGREGVRKFYTDTFSTASPNPRVRGVWSRDSRHVVLLEVSTSSGVTHAIDLITIVAGLIRRLEVFTGGLGAGWIPQPATLGGMPIR